MPTHLHLWWILDERSAPDRCSQTVLRLNIVFFFFRTNRRKITPLLTWLMMWKSWKRKKTRRKPKGIIDDFCLFSVIRWLECYDLLYDEQSCVSFHIQQLAHGGLVFLLPQKPAREIRVRNIVSGFSSFHRFCLIGFHFVELPSRWAPFWLTCWIQFLVQMNSRVCAVSNLIHFS